MRLRGIAEEVTDCADRPGNAIDVGEMTALFKAGRALTPSGLFPLSWKLWCAGAQRPKKRFEGPFGGNTSHPLLFVNSWDMVTPLAAAHRNAELFPGSRVVALDHYGVCPSLPLLLMSCRIEENPVELC